jgi:hypothetical protein
MTKFAWLTFVLVFSLLLNLSCMDGDSVSSSGNYDPEAPSNPSPPDAATGISTDSVTLRWTCSDPNSDDLTYTVFWYTAYFWSSRDSAAGLTSAEYRIENLHVGTGYAWYVVAKDEHGAKTHGPTWSFFTQDEAVTFADYVLELKIRQYIGKPVGDIYASDVNSMSYFNADHCGIQALSGMEYMYSLHSLYLDGNSINDISPLSSLTQLSYIDLSYNNISIISALSDLPQLFSLKLSFNRIVDISPLAGAENLYALQLHHNEISDISALSTLTQFHSLHLEYNVITDLSPLEDMTQLETLYLNANRLSDLSPLSNLMFLYHLEVDSNFVTDLMPLSNLVLMTELYLNHNQIEDISPMSELALLEYLDLSNNHITNIQPLVANQGLTDGDCVFLQDNLLDSVSINVYIPQLEARGVYVYY